MTSLAGIEPVHVHMYENEKKKMLRSWLEPQKDSIALYEVERVAYCAIGTYTTVLFIPS